MNTLEFASLLKSIDYLPFCSFGLILYLHHFPECKRVFLIAEHVTTFERDQSVLVKSVAACSKLKTWPDTVGPSMVQPGSLTTFSVKAFEVAREEARRVINNTIEAVLIVYIDRRTRWARSGMVNGQCPECIDGLPAGGHACERIMLLGEYVEPNYRDYFHAAVAEIPLSYIQEAVSLQFEKRGISNDFMLILSQVYTQYIISDAESNIDLMELFGYVSEEFMPNNFRMEWPIIIPHATSDTYIATKLTESASTFTVGTDMFLNGFSNLSVTDEDGEMGG